MSHRPMLQTALLLGGVTTFWLGSGIDRSAIAIAADLQTIRDRGHLIVGTKAQSSDAARNFEQDIAQQLAKDLFGKADAVKFVPLKNADRLSAVMEDRVDLAIAQVTATDARRRLVDFSPPYYFEVGSLLVRSGSEDSAQALQGQSIAVLAGSSSVFSLPMHLTNPKLVPVANYQAAIDRLKRGEVQAVAGDRLALYPWQQQDPTLQFLKLELGLYPFAIVLPKGLQYGTLREQIHRSIDRVRQSGWLRERALARGLYWAL